jgi:hypothetical protein
MRAKQVFIMWGVTVLFAVATYQPAMAQQVLAVFFEDVGLGTAMSYVFTRQSQTGALIGHRSVWYPQGSQASDFKWAINGNVLTLDFAATRDVINVTGYDPKIDVLFFTRSPHYWAGCRSPYIPRGIPSQAARYLCSLVASSPQISNLPREKE